MPPTFYLHNLQECQRFFSQSTVTEAHCALQRHWRSCSVGGDHPDSPSPPETYGQMHTHRTLLLRACGAVRRAVWYAGACGQVSEREWILKPTNQHGAQR